MHYIISMGEMLIDFIPEAGADASLTYHPHPGGAPANVAVAVARLGGAARFIGMLAQDSFGRFLTDTLRDNQVDIQFIQTTRQALTTLAMVTLEPDGQRQFTFYRTGTADTQLSVEDLNWRAWDDAAICHVGSVALSSDPARSAIFAAIDHTRQVGSLVSFDANIRPALWKSDTDISMTMNKVVERTDILKFSIEEAGFMTASHAAAEQNLSDHQLIVLGEELLQRGPRLVMITLGPRGVLLLTHKQQIEVLAPPIRAVDTTGAGDAFMGAVLYKLVQFEKVTPAALQDLSKQELKEIGTFANRVAALSCTRFGGIASLPFMDELKDDAAHE